MRIIQYIDFFDVVNTLELLNITGNNVSLSKYKGMVLVIVNLASECGLTDRNYKELVILQKVSEVERMHTLGTKEVIVRVWRITRSHNSYG